MTEGPTVVEVLEHVKRRSRRQRCPRCGAFVSVRGVGGDHWWTCTGCEATGIGYSTRAAAIEDLSTDDA